MTKKYFLLFSLIGADPTLNNAAGRHSKCDNVAAWYAQLQIQSLSFVLPMNRNSKNISLQLGLVVQRHIDFSSKSKCDSHWANLWYDINLQSQPDNGWLKLFLDRCGFHQKYWIFRYHQKFVGVSTAAGCRFVNTGSEFSFEFKRYFWLLMGHFGNAIGYSKWLSRLPVWAVVHANHSGKGGQFHRNPPP